MLDRSESLLFDEDLHFFRDSVRRFIAREFTPRIPEFEESGRIARDFWRKAGEAGLLCPGVPGEYGGLGLDFRFNTVVNEELSYAMMADGITLQSDITMPYLLHHAQPELKQRWLPGMVTGEVIAAIAMTEPQAGSDLKGLRTRARREGSDYVIDGAKTYITNGQNADIVFVVCRTDPEAGGRGFSLILVEADRPGFTRGRNLDKIGHWMADTSELAFANVRVPVENLVGEENAAMAHLFGELPQERLSIAISAQAGAQRAFDEALAFTRERKAFGQSILDFQNTRFVMADIAAQLQVGWAHLDWLVHRHLAGRLTNEEAAAAKLWHSEMQWRVCDKALQAHGGAGYMNEYPIARIWRDARVRRIYGGSSEIMREIVGRGLVSP
ncbi:acyl-CoA dehydrogenase family protein [Novosphingobium profundi]|uniref:acyl-CoA dehydrogenase family protein n=1 Tax=Novosphingobium profundi TaxID=1774954 RepID=UPI001CFDB210|nr:acyl-CoA dehydrogenase family protein [Novosphingobium profundi]